MMSTNKKLSEMSLEELYAEKKKVDEAIPSIKNTQHLVYSILFLVAVIAMALYAMKDKFSYVLTGIVVYLVYSFTERLVRGKRIMDEIKSRS